MKSTVAKRIFFGLLMTGALAGLLVGEGYLSVHNYFFLSAGFRGIGFTLFVAIILIKAIQEMARLAWAKGMNPAVWLVVPVIMLLVTQPYWSPQDNETLIIFIILFATLFLSAITQGIKYGTQNTLTNLGVTCLMVIYLGIGGWFLVSLRLLGKDSETIWYQVGPLVMFLSCV
ncbi:MAG: hypothetical protein JW860_11720, partial [Sedimentisphaerales bacterium]|nr:hypothetical protein [Sedimentisphaerales bacterium]